jgi:hypothetical protein
MINLVQFYCEKDSRMKETRSCLALDYFVAEGIGLGVEEESCIHCIRQDLVKKEAHGCLGLDYFVAEGIGLGVDEESCIHCIRRDLVKQSSADESVAAAEPGP